MYLGKWVSRIQFYKKNNLKMQNTLNFISLNIKNIKKIKN